MTSPLRPARPRLLASTPRRPSAPRRAWVLLPLAAWVALAARAEVVIPSSKPAEGSRHVLIESKRSGDTVVALHKRVRDGKVRLLHSEINCKTGQMRELGEGATSLAQIKGTPTAWFAPVQGSSRSDLMRFLCKR